MEVSMVKDPGSTSEYMTNSPEELAAASEEGREPRHQGSLAEIAEDAAQSGVVDSSLHSSPDEVPGETELRAGDPDVGLLESEYNGEEIPGSSMPTPDQNGVDDIDRAYGLTDDDGGQVVLSEESGARRDRHRWELDPRSKDVPG
jgi:hypothetical protein